MNDGQYRCIVSGACPSPVTSNAATMTVLARPAVSTNPTNQTICEGGNATFSITAGGEAITYQWQKRTTSSG